MTEKYGLNKMARLKAEREQEFAASNQEIRLNPKFPYDVIAFSPQTFGITHYSDAPPDTEL